MAEPQLTKHFLGGMIPPRQVAFTGHRDRKVHPFWLHCVRDLFPDAEWGHGGAKGFDTQIANYASIVDIVALVFRPDYDTHPAVVAPLRRNDALLEWGQVLVACWDGRRTGGTYYTVQRAAEMGKLTILLPVDWGG